MEIKGLDLETTGLDPRTDRVRLVQVCTKGEVEIIDVFKHPEYMDTLLAMCEDSNIVKIFQNAKFDLSFIRAHAKRRVRYSNIYDTMLAEQVLMAGWSYPYWDKKANEMKKRMPEFSLAALVQKHLGWRMDKDMQKSDWGSAELTQEQMKYAAKDVEVLEPLYNIQRKLLDMNRLTHIAKLEFDALGPIIEMEFIGVGFDWEAAEKLREVKKLELIDAQRELEKEARGNQKTKQVTLFGEDAGVDINFRSPSQITRYLNDKLGIKADSSDVETLKSIEHPFAVKLLKYRGLEKQLQFFEQFEDYGAKSGRLYPFYNQNRANTGRMSSSKPNQQQIPKRGDGKIFRTLFKARSGYKLVKCDFSAIEMRVMAALTKDRAMSTAINTGVDLHKLTASKVARKDIKDVTKEERQRAKAVNFGFLYAMGAPTFKRYAWMQYGLKITEEEAVDIRTAFFELYKDLAQWHIDQKREMYKPQPYFQHTAERGYFSTPVAIQRTLLGRARFWPNFADNTTASPSEYYNSCVQGSSADMTKVVLIRLYEQIPDDVYIVAAVHDEVVLEAPEDKAKDMEALMLKIMCEEGSKMLKTIPVDAEGVIGDTWGS